MRKLNVGTVLLIALFFSPLVQWAVEEGGSAKQDAKAREIVKKMDDLYRSTSSKATMEMEIITSHWKRTLKIDSWTLGMEKSFFRILMPKKERGMATLKLGNEMWNFLPKTDKTMKIPPSMMMGSWMGSDFTNDDLVKEYTFMDDYTFELTTVDKPEQGVIYVKCVPREGLPIVWGHQVLAVKEGNYMPVWQRYYDEKGKLMREMLFKDVKKFGNRSIPAVMELVPLHKKGNKTIVRYLDAEFDIKVDKKVFSLRNLRSKL